MPGRKPSPKWDAVAAVLTANPGEWVLLDGSPSDPWRDAAHAGVALNDRAGRFETRVEDRAVYARALIEVAA